MSQRVHCNEILAHLMGLIEDNLKTSLSLNGIYRGDMNWLPPEDITSMVNGVWVTVKAPIGFSEVQLPKNIEVTYPIRILYVKRVDVSRNVLEAKIADTSSIVEMIYDNFRLSSLSLSNAQALWALPRTAEMEPPEDALVSTISADLVTCAVDLEVKVRTRI